MIAVPARKGSLGALVDDDPFLFRAKIFVLHDLNLNAVGGKGHVSYQPGRYQLALRPETGDGGPMQGTEEGLMAKTD
jgi:hypothetical protein